MRKVMKVPKLKRTQIYSSGIFVVYHMHSLYRPARCFQTRSYLHIRCVGLAHVKKPDSREVGRLRTLPRADSRATAAV